MSFKLKLLRSVYRLLGVVAPQFSARRLVGIFLTPAAKGDRSAFDPTLNVTTETLQFEGEWLPLFRFNQQGSAKRRLLLCHGWRGKGEQLIAFVAPLVTAGYEVIAFDGPAHAESERRQTNLVQFSQFIKEVAAHVEGIEGALGHSFGASALVYAMHRGLALNRVVLLAPTRSVEVAFGQFARVLGVSAAQVALSLQHMRDVFAEHLEAWDLAALAKGSQTQTLIVHDQGDRQISIEESRQLAHAWPAAQLYETRGIGHQRMLKHPDVVLRTTHFLAAPHGLSIDEPERAPQGPTNTTA